MTVPGQIMENMMPSETQNETGSRRLANYLKNSAGFFFNRPLHDEEKELRLDQKQAMPVPPRDYRNVIKLNSTYLEIVDAGYQERGSVGSNGAGIALVGSFLLVASIFGYCKFIGEPDPLSLKWGCYLMFIGFPMMILLSGVIAWSGISLAKAEIGQYTHYPIRFNRKNGMVYCFEPHGKVTTTAWDDIFFYFHRNNRTVTHITYWGVRGHILEPDGNTVKNGFALPVMHNCPLLPAAFFEFVRLYMEKGTESLPKVQYCLPIADEKESDELATFKTQLDGSGYSDLMVAIGSFGCFCRKLVFATCKIPVWPDWVEAECQVDADNDFCQTAAQNDQIMSESLARQTGAEDEAFFHEILMKADTSGSVVGHIMENYPH